MASRVPHASFVAAFPADAEFPDPPGVFLARSLESYLQHLGKVEDFDNWRDCGWVIGLGIGEKQFEIYFAPFEGANHWLLAVAPVAQPGILGKLLGRKPLPIEAELKVISEKIHALLTATSHVSGVRWMLGGPPGKVPHVSDPAQLEWSVAL